MRRPSDPADVARPERQLKSRWSMIVDPFGDVLAECRTLGNDVAIATCSHDKIAKSGGHRYREARRPGLVDDSGIGGPRPYARQWHRPTRTTE